MNLRQMEVFNAIMKVGSVTEAARLLNVTQPAISAVLRHCETTLKFKLFDRVRGRLVPTPEAEEIYPYISSVFERIEAIDHMTRDLSGAKRGVLSVAATFAIANGPLANAAAQLVRLHPDIRITINSLPTAQVVSRVARREANFGIGFGPILDSSVESQSLAASEVACIMPKDHRLAGEAAISPNMLRHENIITYAPYSLIGALVETAFKAEGVDIRRTVQINYSSTAYSLVEQGVGLALVEPFLLRSQPSPLLVARRLVPAIPIETHLIQSIGSSQSASGNLLLRLLTDEILAIF
ncbi:LysR family transcriptional regulator [Propylenella binzhouense]|nr:LysR substrate-binding domain-containing protein [Propylenella binzhouense]